MQDQSVTRAAVQLIAAFVTAAIIVELMLRALGPRATQHYVWPPHTKRVMHPQPALIPGVAGESRFTINGAGLRGRDAGPAATELRVLAVGASTTECLYLDDARAWPTLLEEALGPTSDGRATWVGNAGRSGMSARDNVVHVKYLTAELPRIDVVLVLAGINDLTVALAQGDHGGAPTSLLDPGAEAAQVRRAFAVAPGRLNEVSTDEQATREAPWFKKTALYQLAKRARRGSSGAQLDDRGEIYATWRAHRGAASRIVDEAPDLRGALAEYRRNLELIVDQATAHAARVVLLTQPTLWRRDLPPEAARLLWLGGQGDFMKVEGSAYYGVGVMADAMRLFNDVLLQVCQARSLDCLDLAARIPRDTTMFYDDAHYTEKGSAAVATAIAEHLRQGPPYAAAVP